MLKKEISAAIQRSLFNRGLLSPLSFFDSRKYKWRNSKGKF
jgi:hypothetical protein